MIRKLPRRFSSLQGAAVFMCLLGLAFADAGVAEQADRKRPGIELLNLEDGLAMDGFDPVSYFPEGGGKPRPGLPKWTTRQRGVTYRFASAKNLELFLHQPHKFEPANGGWCAWAMAKDDRVEVDAESFLIQDGELLLFFDGFFADTRKKWRKGDASELMDSATKKWSAYFKQPERDLARWNHLDGLALGGYDPVLFHTAPGEAIAGVSKFSALYKGLTYRFETDENRTTFLSDPASFELGVGGWDPFLLQTGERRAGDPKVSIFHQGRTFLFASEASKLSFMNAPAKTVFAAQRAFEPRLRSEN